MIDSNCVLLEQSKILSLVLMSIVINIIKGSCRTVTGTYSGETLMEDTGTFRRKPIRWTMDDPDHPNCIYVAAGTRGVVLLYEYLCTGNSHNEGNIYCTYTIDFESRFTHSRC
jgi:hypothetical protein